MLRAMATKAAVSVEEYLAMSFDGPTPELVDGEIVERGEVMLSHSKAQSALLYLLRRAGETHRLLALVEARLRLGVERIRVADVAAYLGEGPADEIPTEPPFLIAEIVSRDDRHVDILTKLAEYQAWGVGNIWLVDPWTRRLSVYDGELHTVRSFSLPDLDIEITPEQLFD